MFGNGDGKKGVDLASFVGGIVRALTKGQQALPKARREQITKHFEYDDTEKLYRPKTLDFEISAGQVVKVPTFSLARVNNIGIDSAVISCSARIVSVEDSELNCELADHTSLVKYEVIPARSGRGNFDIKIRFEKKTDCEAEEKLNEFLQGLVEIETVSES